MMFGAVLNGKSSLTVLWLFALVLFYLQSQLELVLTAFNSLPQNAWVTPVPGFAFDWFEQNPQASYSEVFLQHTKM